MITRKTLQLLSMVWDRRILFIVLKREVWVESICSIAVRVLFILVAVFYAVCALVLFVRLRRHTAKQEVG